MKITSVHAREILDSRGNPTVEADVILDDGTMGRAAVPSGASTGAHEAHELRDGDKSRYGGKGVSKAVENVNGEIAKAINGKDAGAQAEIDAMLIALDGTPNKGRLGANAILAVSLATAKAAATEKKVPLYEYVRGLSSLKREMTLPLPQINILNGGAHTSWESTDLQEFIIMPVGAPTFGDGLRMAAEIFHTLRAVLKDKKYGTLVGDEGGYAPKLQKGNAEAFELISIAVEQAGYKLGQDIVFGIDGAASEFYKSGRYNFKSENKILTTDEMIAWLASLSDQYPIASLEDCLDQEDWSGWTKLTQTLGNKLQIVGDDLLVTNVEFLKRGIKEKAANAILIKVNQIGTLTETIAAVDMAHAAGWHAVISHRSGETEDTTIAHLVVGLGTGQIKTGSMSRTDRLAKYNELLRIEELLADKAVFAGNVFRS